MFSLTSYCCATLVNTIVLNDTQRRMAYNGELFESSKPINYYTNKNNQILSNEHNVQTSHEATFEEKEKIAKAVFGAAWTDVAVDGAGDISFNDMSSSRSYGCFGITGRNLQ